MRGAAGAAHAYYEALAHDFACIGAAIFLYSVGCERIGLDALQPLATRTGGVLNHYADVADCTLTEDVYKQLARPFASQCSLRLRTSPELRVGRVYGPVVKDASMEQLCAQPAHARSRTIPAQCIEQACMRGTCAPAG